MRLFTAAAMAALLATPALAAEPESCAKVHFSDVGWTDITATTAVASTVLQALGYETEVSILSVPVTYAGLSKGDIDVFRPTRWDPRPRTQVSVDQREVTFSWVPARLRLFATQEKVRVTRLTGERVAASSPSGCRKASGRRSRAMSFSRDVLRNNPEAWNGSIMAAMYSCAIGI